MQVVCDHAESGQICQHGSDEMWSSTGYVAMPGGLTRVALLERARNCVNLTHLAPHVVTALDLSRDAARVTLDDKTVDAALVGVEQSVDPGAHDVLFAIDATHTFDRTGPDGMTMTADELARATATNLHEEFATVVTTGDLLAP